MRKHRGAFFLVLLFGMMLAFLLGVEDLITADSWINATTYVYPNSSWSTNVNVTGNFTVDGSVLVRGKNVCLANGTNCPSIVLSSNDTGSIGGGLLTAGSCTSGTTTISGAAVGSVAVADPDTYPGDGTVWLAYVSGANTVTVKECAIISVTPSSSVYHVRVIA